MSHSVSASVVLPQGLRSSIPEAPAAPTNGATRSGSNRPNVSLSMTVINSSGYWDLELNLQQNCRGKVPAEYITAGIDLGNKTLPLIYQQANFLRPQCNFPIVAAALICWAKFAKKNCQETIYDSRDRCWQWKVNSYTTKAMYTGCILLVFWFLIWV